MTSLLRLAPLATVTALLAVAAAGCGGSESAQEKWANDVCSPLVDWSKQMKTLANDAKSTIQSPGNPVDPVFRPTTTRTQSGFQGSAGPVLGGRSW